MEIDIYIADTETASLGGRPVELGIISIDENCNILSTYVQRHNPGCSIDPGAQAVHGISDADVADCPLFEGYYSQSERPIYWIGHNAPYDLRCVKGEITPAASLCTLKLSRQYIKGTTNHKLETLKTELGLSDQVSHSALGDCYTTLELLRDHILPAAGVSLLTLFQRQTEPRMVHTMPFGAHKGKQMTLVPKEYREWLLKQGDIDPDLRFTLEKLRDI